MRESKRRRGSKHGAGSRLVPVSAAFAVAGAVAVAAVTLHAHSSARDRSRPDKAQATTPARISASRRHRGVPDSSRATNPFASTALRHYLAHRAGDVTAAVYDVKTRTTYLYRPNVQEQTASIMKVDILATLLFQAHARGVGLTATQRILAEQMIEDSDDDDAEDLWDEEGASTAVGRFDAKAGMDQTVLNTAGYWGVSRTTARDQVLLLAHVLLRSGLLDRGAREYEYRLMRDVTPSQRWGVSAGVPSGATIAIKDGWLPIRDDDWQINSIGSIIGPGRHYLIAVLTNENPTEGYGIETVQRISAAVWSALA